MEIRYGVSGQNRSNLNIVPDRGLVAFVPAHQNASRSLKRG